MKRIASILVLFLLNIGFSAKGNSLYNQKINQAELAIANQNYKEAAMYFISGFALNLTPRPNDLYNALIVAIRNQDATLAFHYANKLSELGVGSKYFERNIFNWLRINDGWDRLIFEAQMNREKNERKNSAMLATLNKMREKYSELMNTSFSTTISYDSLRLLSHTKDSIERELLTIFETNGYLSEYEIGVNMEADTIMADPVFSEIIVGKNIDIYTHEHIYMEPDSFALILMSAQEKGKIGFDFVRRIIFTKMTTSVCSPKLIENRGKCYIQFDAGGKTDVDASRAYMGLCSFDDYIKKVKYVICHPDSDFDLLHNDYKIKASINTRVNLDSAANTNLIIAIPDCGT